MENPAAALRMPCGWGGKIWFGAQGRLKLIIPNKNDKNDSNQAKKTKRSFRDVQYSLKHVLLQTYVPVFWNVPGF